MTVFIVMKNGRVDEVFASREAALIHQSNLIKRWNLTQIVEKIVHELI